MSGWRGLRQQYALRSGWEGGRHLDHDDHPDFPGCFVDWVGI